jgi:hypothetical protein
VSRVVRRSLLVGALALVAVPFSASVAGGQAIPESAVTVTVRKVVVGSGAPSSVTVDCEADAPSIDAIEGVVLNFAADGSPVDTVPAGAFDVVDGAFTISGDTSDESGRCTFTETSTGGAASTSFTCAYEFTPVVKPVATQAEQAGCLEAAGVGVGPVQVNYPGNDDVEAQASTVVFTNTFTAAPLAPLQPAAQVVAKPAFTG